MGPFDEVPANSQAPVVALQAPDASPSFQVGSVAVHGDLVLAPMDGFSDLPFRSLCAEFGSAMSYTPFVNALEILSGASRAQRLLDYLPSERPVVYQLFDSDEARLLQAARAVLDRGPDIIDINMGCSVRCVSGRGAGAGLLRDPRKVGRIIDALVRALPVPVTAKIRLGWDGASLNYLEVARAIADHGGSLIAVHARTRAQGYSGRADWEAIAAVKAAVRIPVLGNGDVLRVEDIAALRQRTGCDGVMIGRGAMGNPWIFRRLQRSAVPPAEILGTAREHLRRMVEYYGEPEGVVLFRKHLTRYLQAIEAPADVRASLLTSGDERGVAGALEALALPAAV